MVSCLLNAPARTCSHGVEERPAVLCCDGPRALRGALP